MARNIIEDKLHNGRKNRISISDVNIDQLLLYSKIT